MVTLSIDGDILHITMQGHHKLWALKSTLSLPLADIREVRHDPERAGRWWKGFRFPGTHAPGLYAAGTFYESDMRPDFWSVRRPENAIVIRCASDADYDEIIVEVEDPEAEVARLRNAIPIRA
jgi:hypothetical protein